jgi:polysaccharide biosynthesis/export protein
MKNYKYSLIFLLLASSSNSLISQELNKEFLNSLPKSVQEEFMNQDSDDDLTENFNMRPDTRLSKIESGVETIKAQVEAIENELNKEETEGELKIFGENFFDSYQTSFAPLNEQNFSADYVLDVGDVLNIQSLGSINAKNKVIIARDGSVNIPKVGQITVAGMPYEDAIKSIREYVKSKFLDVDLYVNLEKSRDMTILLIGNAANPGVYTMPGGSSILSVLHAAGGIGETGSYRKILHKRNNNVIQEIDLYDVLISGNLLFKTPLRSGDAIIVGAPKKMVSISGGVNTPALYELKENENLRELINLAQGFSANAYNSVQIHRASGSVDQLERQAIDSKQLQHGDSVKVPLFSPANVKTYTVKLNGAVKRPGVYSFTYGKTLHQLIEDAGGYLDSAYPEGGAIYRTKVAEIQKEYFDKTYKELISFLATSGARQSPGSQQNLQLILVELKNADYPGRLVAEFNPVKVSKNPAQDTILADDDEITIPYFSSDVFVAGDILNPGGRQYISGTTFNEYINQSGGLGRFADDKRIIIIKPNGDAQVVKSRLFSQSGVDIFPGSTIYVPREIGKLDGIALSATLAPIASSLALSLASLNSIN